MDKPAALIELERVLHDDYRVLTQSALIMPPPHWPSQTARDKQVMTDRSDPTPVPDGIQAALDQCITECGFKIIYGTPVDGDGDDCLGETDFRERTVTLRWDLTPAARARVTCHELTHILIAGTYGPESMLNVFAGIHEWLAEGTAALVTRRLAITDSQFSTMYLAGLLHRVPPSEREEALDNHHDECVSFACLLLGLTKLARRLP